MMTEFWVKYPFKCIGYHYTIHLPNAYMQNINTLLSLTTFYKHTCKPKWRGRKEKRRDSEEWCGRAREKPSLKLVEYSAIAPAGGVTLSVC